MVSLSLLPGASVSTSVKTDGFCSGAAGPVFCSLSPAFLECSAIGRRWKSGLRESRLRLDGLPAVNGEFDLQRVVTQEELVKRDTPPGAMRQGGVHCCGFALERANFADRADASSGDCPFQGCPGSGVSRRAGANRFCRELEVAPLSLGVCPGGPLVRESVRLHAKLECGGETDLPHVVSENFSKPGNLLEAGRHSCVPLYGQRVEAKFCEPELQNALVQMHGDPFRGCRGSGRRTGSSTLLMKKPSSATLSRSQASGCSSACGARAEAGRHDSIESVFDRCADPVTRFRRVTSVMHHNLGFLSHAHSTARNSQLEHSRATVVHGRVSSNSENSVGDTEEGGQRFCVPGGTKSLSTSTRLGSGVLLCMGPLIHSRRLLKLHVEMWEGLFCVTRARRFSGKWKSYRGVLSVWPVLHVLIILLSHLGQAE